MYALPMSPHSLVAIGRPFSVLGAPATPTHLSRVTGWSITPRTGWPLCSRAIKVPNKGLPAGCWEREGSVCGQKMPYGQQKRQPLDVFVG